MGFVGWLLSAVWQGFLSLFGKSDAQKLGEAEVENADLKTAVKEKEYEAKVFSAPARPESDVLASMRKSEHD